MSPATKQNTYNNDNNNVAYTFYYMYWVFCVVCVCFFGTRPKQETRIDDGVDGNGSSGGGDSASKQGECELLCILVCGCHTQSRSVGSMNSSTF